jgi:hypothetical protein
MSTESFGFGFGPVAQRLPGLFWARECLDFRGFALSWKCKNFVGLKTEFLTGSEIWKLKSSKAQKLKSSKAQKLKSSKAQKLSRINVREGSDSIDRLQS